MTDDDRTAFGIALHERVRDEHPDLDELIRVSTSRGTRLRRRRRIGVAAAATVCVAVVAVGGSQLTGSPSSTGGEPGIATQPSASSSSAQDAERQRELDRLARQAQKQAQALMAPVHVDAPGWRCDVPMDEKFICSKDQASVVVTWRERAGRPAYLDPDKADVLDGVHTFVSEAHGQYFATVAPAPGTTQAEVDEVGAALVWSN